MKVNKWMLIIPGNNFKKINYINPLSANPTIWSNTLKQFVGKSRRII